MGITKEEMREMGFDPNLSPGHPTNQAAAARNNLQFDEEEGSYVDAEKGLVLNKFGQAY